MNKFICVHGHFYQPPRENPWLEAITYQESAHPFHDWNDRINAECYAPNSRARILDEKGFITGMHNNYSQISFDFGPTLLSWMENHAPDTYQAILEADQISLKKFSGHGSAMAQCYSHMIMPLANTRDKYTQVYWGVRDFELRFKRLPEGMWLPETAVDLETLEIMADLGIRFTILAPHQASQLGIYRGRSGRKEALDIYQPYRVRLAGGKSICVFFYNGPLSQELAFKDILQDGKYLAEKLLQVNEADKPRLLSIATDGETYGHHHKFGDMALAFALQCIENNSDARLTNFPEYLEKFPPQREIGIKEKTSWSCEHGVGRWSSDCGCQTGGRPEWDQKWRAPLRRALDWVQDKADYIFMEIGREIFKDPWLARNAYIDVHGNRSGLDDFLTEHSQHKLNDSEKIVMLKLLEMQRNSMFMYTSCGWFFNDVSGIETEQILLYAGKAIQYAEELAGDRIEPRFLELLEMAESNLLDRGNGALVYKGVMERDQMDFSAICAHYALDSLFDLLEGEVSLYAHSIELLHFQDLKNNRARMVYGSVKVTSDLTRESSRQEFCAVHSGDHKIKAFVCGSQKWEASDERMKTIKERFAAGAYGEVLSALEDIFGTKSYPLKFMSRNEQKTIQDQILFSTLSENAESYARLYDSFKPLNEYLKEEGVAPPKLFLTIMEAVLNTRLLEEINKDKPDLHLIEILLSDVDLHSVSLDVETLGKFFEGGIENLALQITRNPKDLSLLESFESIVGLLVAMPLRMNLWKVQNLCFQMMNSVYGEIRKKSTQGDQFSMQWIARFDSLAHSLMIRVPQETKSP